MDVTDESFEQDVVERSRREPVVVDFWAEWCGPCRALAPVLEAAVGEREGVVLAKVDVDANPQVAERFGIRGIPAVKAFRDGRAVAEFVGAQSRPSVDRFLDELLAPPAGDRLADELRASGEDPELLALLEERRYEEALELLLGRLDGDGTQRDAVRQRMVAIFEHLGLEDDVATRYRRRLASALY